MARSSAEVSRVIQWFQQNARPLPWREPEVSAWGILVSEFMLQQTQVDRVIPKWQDWMRRWPSPSSLATAPVADVLRAWQGLGYPRRAMRLHASALAIVSDWGGEVPADESSLLALPGVGQYTAAAIACFAFGRPSVVLDTKIRRVIARAWEGQAAVASHLTNAERERAQTLVAQGDGARWSAAVMELGAVVCTARAPSCEQCPLASSCAWLAAGRPQNGPQSRKQPTFEGSDRQARGALLKAVSAGASIRSMEAVWPDAEQRERALSSLMADGLIARTRRGYALPS